MKKVILFLFTLSAVVSVQAQMMSSGSSIKSGIYNSVGDGLEFSGKISTIESECVPAVDPTYKEESKVSTLGTISDAIKSKLGVDKSSSSKQKSMSYNVNNDKIYFAWNFIGITGDELDYLTKNSSISFTLGYSHASNLYKNLLYLDYGVSFALTETEYCTDAWYDGSCYSDFIYVEAMELRIPVNLMFNVKLSNRIALRPYAGLALEYNIFSEFEGVVNKSNTLQIGSQYGLGLNMGKFYLGVERRRLLKVEDDPNINFKSTSLCVGITF